MQILPSDIKRLILGLTELDILVHELWLPKGVTTEKAGLQWYKAEKQSFSHIWETGAGEYMKYLLKELVKLAKWWPNHFLSLI